MAAPVVGAVMVYTKTNATCTILQVHYDDGEADPYFTIRLDDGTEKQTTAQHLGMGASHSEKVQMKIKVKELDDQTWSADSENSYNKLRVMISYVVGCTGRKGDRSAEQVRLTIICINA